jgi:hypothetical protein
MTEVPLFPLWVTVLLTVWGLIGPLAGIGIGHYLTRSWQKKQWTLDNKKAEYRELISTLSQSAHFILNNSPYLTLPNKMGGLKSGEQERQSDEAADRGHSIIADRIFIANFVAEEHIAERWSAVLKEKRVDRFWREWGDLHRLLLRAAREDLKLRS